MKKINKEFLIWFAGFFEGEGSAGISKRVVYLTISQCEKNNGKFITQLIKEKFGGYVRCTKRFPHHDIMWIYYLSGAKRVYSILNSFVCYALFKRDYLLQLMDKIKSIFVHDCIICGQPFWIKGGIYNKTCSPECKKKRRLIINKEWRERNLEKIKKSKKQDYLKHTEGYKSRAHRHYVENKDRHHQQSKEWARRNPKKRKEICLRYYYKKSNRPYVI